MENKKTKFQRFKDSRFVKAITSSYSYITETSAYKVLTGKAFGRALAIGTLVAGAAGLMTVAPAALGVMAAAIATTVAVDTYMVYKTKQLYKEAKLLRDNRVSIQNQEDILEKNPNFVKALEGKLFTPEKHGSSKTKVYTQSKNKALSFARDVLLNSLEGAGSVINHAVSHNPVGLITDLTSAVTGIYTVGSHKYSLTDARANLKNFINEERKQHYSPGYDDKKSLKDQVNKQRIQTMALKEMSKIKDIDKWTPEQIQKQFSNFSKLFEKRANAIQENRNIFVKYGRKLFKNLIEAHNPFSQYTDSKKLNKIIVKDKPNIKELSKSVNLSKNKTPSKQNNSRQKPLPKDRSRHM